MKRPFAYLFILFLSTLAMQASEGYCFRVYLKDKGHAVYRLDHPETFLSPEAIERRIRRNIPIEASDLPIPQAYIDTLESVGGRLVVQSKWMKTAVIAGTDSLLAERLKQLSIVDSVKWVWKGETETTAFAPENSEQIPKSTADVPVKSRYGYAEEQIKMLNGIKLHKAGFQGEGIRVAVIDAGFKHVDRIQAFDSLRLIGTYNVVSPGKSVYEEDEHGTRVLSCLAAYTPGIMVGTAPKASYWLIKSEDSQSEFPIEEDYWLAAVEYADSVGVEVITSSLGYFSYDLPEWNHKTDELDGRTAQISRAAQMATQKGLLLFCSAGNEGAGNWKKITFPADAQGIVTVGAITNKKRKCNFSSVGFTADGRVKPDLVALGSGCCIINAEGEIHYANGTSFATPILAGLGICLWQALPSLSAQELIALLQQGGSQYTRPDTELGYGIPNVYKSYKRGKKLTAKSK